MKLRLLVGAAALAAAVSTPQSSTLAATAVITVVDGAYTEPAVVTIQVGDTVVFINQGVIAHNPTAEDGSFKLPALKSGESASVTFTEPGTVPFLCTLHTAQRGTIIVRSASAEPAQAPLEREATPVATPEASEPVTIDGLPEPPPPGDLMHAPGGAPAEGEQAR